ncbi:MAG: hypothetical protein HN377_10700 [Alphaproteobacteria bacterium]|jgi:hypothetical protein|nr:hypothetical protein [Alphaproteobacteria bacterium]
MHRTIIFGLVAAMIASKASAEVANHADTSGNTEIATQAPIAQPGFYGQLTAGNQNIADALFDAQQAADDSPVWTLDSIAKAKMSGPGWGAVFTAMKADGVLRQKRLGQVISQAIQKRRPAGQKRPYRSDVVVTTADGKRVVVSLTRPQRRSQRVARAKTRQTTPQTVAGGVRDIATAVEIAALAPVKLQAAPIKLQAAPLKPRRTVTYRWVTGRQPVALQTQSAALLNNR